MGFRKDAYATVWGVEEGKGNSLKVRLSVSRKNRETQQYETEFSGFCSFIGTAKAKGEKLKERDRIKLGDVDVTTWYNKEKNVDYTMFKVFDFDYADAVGKATDVAENPTEGDPTKDGDDLPF